MAVLQETRRGWDGAAPLGLGADAGCQRGDARVHGGISELRLKDLAVV